MGMIPFINSIVFYFSDFFLISYFLVYMKKIWLWEAGRTCSSIILPKRNWVNFGGQRLELWTNSPPPSPSLSLFHKNKKKGLELRVTSICSKNYKVPETLL